MSNTEAVARYKVRHPERVRAQTKRRYQRRPPEHNHWRAMIDRCNNHPDYIARGIKICARWRRSFKNFLADMGPRPSSRHSVDRYPDNDGDYTPDNCRWAVPAQQTRNTHQNRIIVIGGRRQPLCDWAIESGVNYGTIRTRLRDGWPTRQAIFQPARAKAA